MNIGKYIFAQVIDFIPRYQFDKLVKKYKGDWHAKDLSCYNQLLHLLFGQITGCVFVCAQRLMEVAYTILEFASPLINPIYVVLMRKGTIASTKDLACI